MLAPNRLAASAVVVVGAGPSGLATACGLRAAGVDARVLDAADRPARTSRALGLQPRGAEVLARLGALGDLPSRCLPIHRVVVSVDGRELARLRVGMPTPLVRRPGLLVGQTGIEQALRDRLAELGGHVEWRWRVSGLEQDGDGVTLHTTRGPVRAGWVVGADGAHSAVRHGCGIGFPGVPLVERFLLADVDLAPGADLGLTRESVGVWLRGQEMVGAFPLPDGGADRRWRLMAPAPEPADDVAAALIAMLASHTGRAVDVDRVDWTSEFRIHRRLADTYRRGRVLLAGDAAHIHSPFGGQGLNTGIGDAENLAWKLAAVVRGHAGGGLLDSYGAERRPVAAEVLAATSGLTGAVLGRGAVARTLRDHVLVPLLDRPLVQRLLWEQASQLRISYRGGPLAPRSWSRGPRPGDRVPDLPCRTAGGTPTTLHAALGRSWAVLAPTGAAGDECVAAAHAALGPLVTELRVPDARAVLVVRPDAHLAWRGRSATGLRDRLAAILGPVDHRAGASAGS